MASVLLIGVALAGCGSSGGRVTPPSLSVIRDAARDLPSVTFNGCRIPVDQPTWANILLTGGRNRFRGPYHAAWAIDGKADTSDPQRTVTIPGRGTRLELRVTLRSVGQTFHIEVFNAHGSVGSYSFTNTDPLISHATATVEPGCQCRETDTYAGVFCRRSRACGAIPAPRWISDGSTIWGRVRPFS